MRSGIILLLLSMSLTPFGDGLSKYLGEGMAPLTIVFWRYFLAGLLALLLARLKGAPLHLPRAQWGGLIFRTSLVMAAMSCLVIALTLVPLANAVGGFLIAPLVAALLGVLLLGEPLNTGKILGAVISFAGALAMLHPGLGIEGGSLLGLLGGVLLGMFLTFTRKTRSHTDPVSQLARQCLLGSLMLAPLALLSGIAFDLIQTPVLIGLGLITALTHFLTVAAYQRSPASQLAPFFYFSLIVALIIGYFWFEELPGLWELMGLGAIVLGGLVSTSDLFGHSAARARNLAKGFLGFFRILREWKYLSQTKGDRG